MNPDIAKALVEFQQKLKGFPNKNKTVKGAKFKYSYADLDEVINAIRPALLLAGLYFTQECIKDEEREGFVKVKTTVIHKSGASHDFASSCPMQPPGTNACQSFGSSMTFARRYALVGVFGIPTVDNDANFTDFQIIDPEVDEKKPREEPKKTSHRSLRGQAKKEEREEQRAPRAPRAPRRPRNEKTDIEKPNFDKPAAPLIPKFDFIPEACRGQNPRTLTVDMFKFAADIRRGVLDEHKPRLAKPQRDAIRILLESVDEYCTEYMNKLGMHYPDAHIDKPDAIAEIIKDIEESGKKPSEAIDEVPF